MRWSINLKEMDRPEVAEAVQYCKDFLAKFDTSNLDWVNIDNGRKDAGTRTKQISVRNTEIEIYISIKTN